MGCTRDGVDDTGGLLDGACDVDASWVYPATRCSSPICCNAERAIWYMSHIPPAVAKRDRSTMSTMAAICVIQINNYDYVLYLLKLGKILYQNVSSTYHNIHTTGCSMKPHIISMQTWCQKTPCNTTIPLHVWILEVHHTNQRG